MNKKIYIAPCAKIYEIKTEGVVAQSQSIPIHQGGGNNEQLSNQKEMENCGDWSSSEDYWK